MSPRLDELRNWGCEKFNSITNKYFNRRPNGSLLVNKHNSERCEIHLEDEINADTTDLNITSPPDVHTFVALIDIVYTDGSGRTCTGTIIHSNAVITAAHCFINEDDAVTKVELTLCFVVIGNKKMFDTGYEQYLPIEKVATHPKFNGWTADLALVYTFAGMTSDKPGTVIGMAKDHLNSLENSSVTVLSWGGCKYDETTNDESVDGAKESESTRYSTSFKKHFHSSESKDRFVTKMGMRRRPGKIDRDPGTKDPALGQRDKYSFRSQTSDHHNIQHQAKQQLNKLKRVKRQSIKLRSLYLTSVDQQKPKRRMNRLKKTDNGNGFREQVRNIKDNYKNWRRKMGSQKNKLTVETFELVNVQTCRKLVEKTMPGPNELNDNSIICYTNEENFITADDSGAPALLHDKLLAITVGGVQHDGNQVGLGVRISCFCDWIAKHLPSGGENLSCCVDCCSVGEAENPETKIGRTGDRKVINDVFMNKTASLRVGPALAKFRSKDYIGFSRGTILNNNQTAPKDADSYPDS